MTTIAWDGEYLAADQGSWVGGHIDKHIKAHRILVDGSRTLYACVGQAGFANRMMRHIENPEQVPLPDWRMHGLENGGQIVGIMVFPFGVIYEVDAMGIRVKMEGHGTRGVFAAGGGREMALGALLAGASAQRAVEIATEYSDYGGHGVTVLKHDQGDGNG